MEINLNEEGTKLIWGKVQEDSFQQWKDNVSSDSVLEYHKTNRSCQLAAKWHRERLLVTKKYLWVVTFGMK